MKLPIDSWFLVFNVDKVFWSYKNTLQQSGWFPLLAENQPDHSCRSNDILNKYGNTEESTCFIMPVYNYYACIQ